VIHELRPTSAAAPAPRRGPRTRLGDWGSWWCVASVHSSGVVRGREANRIAARPGRRRPALGGEVFPKACHICARVQEPRNHKSPTGIASFPGKYTLAVGRATTILNGRCRCQCGVLTTAVWRRNFMAPRAFALACCVLSPPGWRSLGWQDRHALVRWICPRPRSDLGF